MPKSRKTFKEYKAWWKKTHHWVPPATEKEIRGVYKGYHQNLDRQKRNRKALKRARARGKARPRRRRVKRR